MTKTKKLTPYMIFKMIVSAVVEIVSVKKALDTITRTAEIEKDFYLWMDDDIFHLSFF